MRIHCLQNKDCELARKIAYKRLSTQNELVYLSYQLLDTLNDTLSHDKEALIYALFSVSLRQLRFIQRLDVLASIFHEFRTEVKVLATLKRESELKEHNCYR